MAKDIVERMKHPLWSHSMAGWFPSPQLQETVRDMAAAAEIARFRAELDLERRRLRTSEELRTGLAGASYRAQTELAAARQNEERLAKEWDAARQDAERLREALNFVIDFKISDSNGSEVAEDSLHEARKIARAALHGATGESREEKIRRVAAATIRKHAASPLTSTPEFWERIVATILDEATGAA